MLTAAIVEDHTFQIDAAMRRYGDWGDTSIFQGHFYAAKPIGYSVIAVPFYAFIRRFSTERDLAANIWSLRLFLNLLPLGLFSVFLFRYLQTKLGLGPKAYLLIAALLLGTLYYPFAQLFMGHVLTGILWFVAFYWITENEQWKYSLAGGALLGVAFLIEILTVIPIAAGGLYLLLRKRSLVIPFVIGAFVCSLPAFLYNWHAFGGPLEWMYKHTSEPQFQANDAQGYVGLLWPSPTVLWNLTFGSNRGFFFCMPHLLFGVLGLVLEKKDKAKALLALSIVGGNFLLISGTLYWDGGWCFGPRYLIPVIPFLIYGSALWLRQLEEKMYKGLGSYCFTAYLVLVAITIPIMLLATVTWPFSPRFLPNPILWEYVTLFWRGFFGLNLGDYLGMSDQLIRAVAIVSVIVPGLLFAFWSKLLRGQLMIFGLTLILVFPISLLLLNQIEKRTSAQHCFAIGRAGYIQGNYAKALPFLQLALDRSPDQNLQKETLYFISLIKANNANKKQE